MSAEKESAEKDACRPFVQKMRKTVKTFLKEHKGFVIFTCIALIPVVLLVRSAIQESCYSRGISMVEAGDYENAIVCFQKLGDEYRGTRGYIRLCNAMIKYENGEYLEAYWRFPYYFDMEFRYPYHTYDMDEKQIQKEYPEYALYEQLHNKVETAAEPFVEAEREQNRIRAERERAAFLAELSEKFPYVGLEESDVAYTRLGRYSKKFNSYSGKTGYTWQNSAGYYFYVYCRDGEVVEVRDCRDDPVKPIRFVSRPRASSTPNPYPGDIYGIGSIRDAEELYEEYPDDFESIDEAEEYFNAYRK